jgi:hypothetical protein
MKRDMDLFRSLLLKVEEQPVNGPFTTLKFPVTLKTKCGITRNWRRTPDSSKRNL